MSEQRLSVTFGAFSCDVVGYDDPFAILNLVVELFTEIAQDNPDFVMGTVRMTEDERAHVAAGLADQASRIEEMADTTAVSGARYVLTNENAPAPTADAASEMVEEVVAPVEDQTATGAGDLELRDTLSGTDAPLAEEAEMRIPGAAQPAQPVEQTFDEKQTGPALTEETVAEMAEEPSHIGIEDAVARAVAELDVPEVETSQKDSASETSDIAPMEEAAILEEPVAEETVAPIEVPEVEAVAEPAAETTSLRAPKPVEERRPLRLTMPSAAAETETAETSALETLAAKAKAPEVETEAEKPAAAKPKGLKSTVSVTRLPLRSDNKRVQHKVKKKTQTLTAVQKVEPVVTLSPSIAESATAAADMTRAERLRANMERRNQDDESDNFLFSDVDEAIREATTDAEATNYDDTLPLTNMLAEVEAAKPEDEKPTPAEKKARRSLADLLGFGKGRRNAEPEDTAEEHPQAEEAPTKTASRSDGFDRLRESVAAAMPTTEKPSLPLLQPATISEAIDYDDETSPAAFARRVGANTLQDLLEVSAVYMAVVEGKSKFSRRDVMQALNHIGADKDYTQEARLKSFRKLLTTGSLVRVDDGLFSISHATRFGYETQLQA